MTVNNQDCYLLNQDCCLNQGQVREVTVCWSLACLSAVPVSYTHLDVYKRQLTDRTFLYRHVLISYIDKKKNEIFYFVAIWLLKCVHNKGNLL